MKKQASHEGCLRFTDGRTFLHGSMVHPNECLVDENAEHRPLGHHRDLTLDPIRNEPCELLDALTQIRKPLEGDGRIWRNAKLAQRALHDPMRSRNVLD